MFNAKTHFRPYQAEAAKFLSDRNEAALFLDPGLGKTATTLHAFEHLRAQGLVRAMLVIAPLSVARSTWQDEVKEWEHTKWYTSSFIHGSHADKLAAIQKDAEVYITNYESIPWMWKFLQHKSMDEMPFQIMVLDELTKVKNTDTQRFGYMRSLRKCFPYRWGLTGTPAPNSMLELWGQLYVLDSGKCLGDSLVDFRSQYFEKNYMGYNYVIIDGADEKITERIRPLCLTHQAKEVLAGVLPEMHKVYHRVHLPPNKMEAYKAMEEDFILEMGDGEAVTAVSAGVLWQKLTQLAQGFLYQSDPGDPEAKRVTYPQHDAKIEAVIDLVDEMNGQPVLIMYKYNYDLELLRAAFKSKKPRIMDGKPETIADWNAGKVEVMLCQPQSAGHGLNLQEGGHQIIWYCMESSNERYIQANARLYRLGQKRDVIVHHLLAGGTVDYGTKEVLEGRASMQDKVLDMLSARQRQPSEDAPGASGRPALRRVPPPWGLPPACGAGWAWHRPA